MYLCLGIVPYFSKVSTKYTGFPAEEMLTYGEGDDLRQERAISYVGRCKTGRETVEQNSVGAERDLLLVLPVVLGAPLLESLLG